MNKFGLHTRLKAKEGNGYKLCALLMEIARILTETDACHVYVVSLDEQDEDLVWLTEIWDSEEARDSHLTIEEVRLFLEYTAPLLEEPLGKGQLLYVVGGVGIKRRH